MLFKGVAESGSGNPIVAIRHNSIIQDYYSHEEVIGVNNLVKHLGFITDVALRVKS